MQENKGGAKLVTEEIEGREEDEERERKCIKKERKEKINKSSNR